MLVAGRCLLTGLPRQIRRVPCMSISLITTPSAVIRRQNYSSAPEMSTKFPAGFQDLGFDTELKQYSVENFSSVIKNDIDRKRVHLILLELAECELYGKRPPFISETDMASLIEMHSSFQRKSYYKYMFITQMREINAQVKKKQRQLEKMSMPKKDIHLSETIFPLLRPRQERLYQNWRLASAAIFGQKLVFDCSFEHTMKTRYLRSLCTQLQFMHNSNKLSRDPFDIILSDVAKGGPLDKLIDQYLPQMKGNRCLITKSNERYLDMFPRNQLLYLTPHSDNIITEIDPNAVLIVGAIVDQSSNKPLTFSKAKEQNIRHGKLPLGHYLNEFRLGSQQAFSLHVIGEILLKLKETNDWTQAFTKIPSRYLYHIRRTRRSTHLTEFDIKRTTENVST